jgi:nucleoid DNA-binding protein
MQSKSAQLRISSEINAIPRVEQNPTVLPATEGRIRHAEIHWREMGSRRRHLAANQMKVSAPRAAAPMTRGKGNSMPTQLTKSQLIEKIAENTELGKKEVKAVLESMVTVGHKELKKAGVFLVPGFAKFVVIKKPATKERKGINPFTKEPTVFKARPARKIVRARPVKAAKEAV